MMKSEERRDKDEMPENYKSDCSIGPVGKSGIT
jgi:hypothetical protein